MQQSITVDMFKGKMRGYKFFQRQVKKYKEEIELCYDSLGASPKSPNLTSEPIRSPRDIEKEYDTRERIAMLEVKLKRCEGEIRFCDEVLANMEDSVKKAIINVYVHRCTIQSEARRMYMAKSTLQDNINKAIEQAIQDTM